jgi:ribosomal protein S18 acetylase RimI-like enzyme
MIRPYTVADKPTLLEIFKLNTPQYFDPGEVKDFDAYLDTNGDTYLIIEHENKIVGGAGYRITQNNTIANITWIFFHPDSAGLGLGKKSVDHCLAIFKSMPTVEKLVVTTSQLAYKFFEKFGLTLVKTETDYWGPGLHLYLMEKDLT